ncbi:MAG: hypothetical protein M1497_01935 [Nitrospirae bacterium]|nr:hypothetical protein [Nitrospirota bacterium]
MKTERYTLKTIMISMMLATLAAPAYAASEWEAGITATVGNASNRLSAGQKSGATDGFDPGYEVPAMPAGDVRAYFTCEGREVWRDIKGAAPDNLREWDLSIESPLTGKTVTISWDSAAVPGGLTLKDPSTGAEVDMSAVSSYAYVNTGRKNLVIQMKEVR